VLKVGVGFISVTWRTDFDTEYPISRQD